MAEYLDVDAKCDDSDSGDESDISVLSGKVASFIDDDVSNDSDFKPNPYMDRKRCARLARMN